LYSLPVVGFVVHRTLALPLGSRVEDILVGDAIAMAVLLTYAGITAERWMGLVGALAVAYAVAAALFPSWAAPGFGSFMCVAAAIPVFFWRAPARRAAASSRKFSISGVGS